MIYKSRCLLFSSLAALLFLCPVVALQAQLIPQPAKVDFTSEEFVFTSATRWVLADTIVHRVAQPFMDQLYRASGFRQIASRRGSSEKNVVELSYNYGLPPEAYRLKVNRKSIKIESSTERGFYYALQTLFQLMPDSLSAWDESVTRGIYTASQPLKIVVPGVIIRDKPRFGYRGFMLDVSRYFMPKNEVLKLIGYLAMHKINVLHLHLVDDNGWRIEIKKYPKLTDTGAWRVDRINSFPLRANPDAGESAIKGGYYTQEDIREIVAFAARHQIEVIPEIEMPAHTNSSLAAYPHLACPVVESIPGVLPGGGGSQAAVIYCAGNDSVFTFLEEVLTEVMALFPSNYVHIGGDEATKTHWKNCPKCQARMKKHSIPTEEELQSYFIGRINTFLIQHGKQLMGWDELVDSRIPENSVIVGWRGAGLGAETAGAQGFRYIKSPAWYYYFIRYQGPQWFEPFTYFGNTTLKDVYEYEPLPVSVDSSTAKQMLGVQACLWTEFINRPEDAWYMVFPRLAAFAESAWSDPGRKNWMDFNSRLEVLLHRYQWLGIPYARSMYNLQHTVKPSNEKLTVVLDNILPEREIRYTLDGSEPDANSNAYTDSLSVMPGTVVRAAVFQSQIRKGEILSLRTLGHKAAGQCLHSKEPMARVLVNGVRGSEKLTDGEWVDLYDRDAFFEVHWKEPVSISRLGIGLLNNAGMGIHFPSSLQVMVSQDGHNFISLQQYEFSEAERFQQGHFRTTRYFKFDSRLVKALRVMVRNPGITPPWHLRKGTATRVALDELIVE